MQRILLAEYKCTLIKSLYIASHKRSQYFSEKRFIALKTTTTAAATTTTTTAAVCRHTLIHV